jgi:nucleotide-binding universal stress UspA family protein
MRNLVVGVDGTPMAHNALAWAAEVVGPEGTLHAVLALDPIAEYFVDVVTGAREAFRRNIQTDFETKWTAVARDRVARLTTSVAEMNPATALAIAGEELNADAIVVGAHVTHQSLPMRIGSTTQHLLRKLPGPLVVVPSTAAGGLDTARPIVVGVGHGDATEAAVRWVAAVADERDLTVALVHATGESSVSDAEDDPSHRYPRHHSQDAGSQADDIIRWADELQELSDRDLDIRTSQPLGSSTLRLAEASGVASLLVVGQHWSRITLGRHTGQPLRHALTHARCPIVVVPEWTVVAPDLGT